MNHEAEETKDVEQESSPFEDADQINSSSDLENAKRSAQGMFVTENTGATQVFINSVGSLCVDSSQARPASSVSRNNQVYKLHTPRGCADFVEQFKHSDYLAVAIVVSTFELVRLSDLPNLKSLLLTQLPSAKVSDEQDSSSSEDAYISVNSLLSTIGGKWFTTEDGSQCVGLGEEYSIKAIKNIWEQFPVLRAPICRWLIQLSKTYMFRTTFDSYQIVCAFSRIISLDFRDAQRQIFPRLFSDPQNATLLGNIIYKLYDDVSLREVLDRLLLNWFSSASDWLWRPACLVCSFLYQSINNAELLTAMERNVYLRLSSPERGDLTFLAILLIRSEDFRTVVANQLNKAIIKASNRNDRMAVVKTYIQLLRAGYYIVNDKQQGLPLAACDSKEQLKLLSPILRQTITQVTMRKQLLYVFRAYLKELSLYKYSKQLYDHLCAFFFHMTQLAPDYRQDILYFLHSCEGDISHRIYIRLLQSYSAKLQLPSNPQ